jgi:N-formylglutamate deformylase
VIHALEVTPGRESESLADESDGPFVLKHPSGAAAPVLVEVPHAGLIVPREIIGEMDAPRNARLRDADVYVDRLFDSAPAHGATLLVARYSRFVVDLNRAEDDIDAATVRDHPSPRASQPRGVVWRLATDGRPLMKRPLSYAAFERRLERCYRPYHDVLARELERLRETFGHVVLLAAHSMPSVGRALHGDTGAQRADIVPGTRGRTSADARLIDLVDEHFRSAGLTVRHDDPYRGGYSTGHYGRPHENVHAIQIELNRALYVDEQTFEPKEPQFGELVALLDRLVEKVGALELD